MSAPDWDALARAHMVKQVADATVVQAALAQLWDRVIDPADPVASFGRFREQAIPLLQAGRSISRAEATRYFELIHSISALDTPLEAYSEPDYKARHARTSLNAVTRRHLEEAAALQRAGLASSAALNMALNAVLASAKRQVLNGGRARSIALTRSTGYGRWARVSDGAPCAFCAMLVSRGPVYTDQTVGFRAHDGCGCSVRPVLATESGWSEDARTLRALWDDKSDPHAFRRTIDARKRARSLVLAA